ncbi:hypothetical protein IJ670_06910, partial [bacterium]|nr:hypothetical protein [bacterium]
MKILSYNSAYFNNQSFLNRKSKGSVKSAQNSNIINPNSLQRVNGADAYRFDERRGCEVPVSGDILCNINSHLQRCFHLNNGEIVPYTGMIATVKNNSVNETTYQDGFKVKTLQYKDGKPFREFFYDENTHKLFRVQNMDGSMKLFKKDVPNGAIVDFR